MSPYTPPLPAAESYNLDANGNRRTATGVSQTAAGLHNRLQTDGTFNYIYDNEGNVTRRTRILGGQVTDYTWDHRNRLTSVTERAPTTLAITKRTEFVYDLFDQRVGKRLDIGTIGTWDRYEEYIWADGQEVLRMVDSDGQGAAQPFRLTNRYLWGPAVDQLLADEQYAAGAGPAVGATTASTATGANYWALTDHLGSVRDLVDNNGVVREHNVYDSFGRLVREVDYNAAGTVIASTDLAAVDTLFGYTARDFDADVGLQYNRARWYDATNGRWLSQDPIGFAAGDANLYRYVGNQPTGATDPSGHYGKDFHFYVIYLLYRARGWSPGISSYGAGFSQYVDDEPATAPWLGGRHAREYKNYKNFPLMVNLHFWGAKPTVAVTRNPEDLRCRASSAIHSYLQSPVDGTGRPTDIESAALAGIALHAYADTWAHEFFTPWKNAKINVRTGSPRPNYGHADAEEGGEAPDNPYNNVPKALQAAKEIYYLIPQTNQYGGGIEWSELEPVLREAFSNGKLDRKYDSEISEMHRIQMIKNAISRFRSDPIWFADYNVNEFANHRGKFGAAFYRWMDSCPKLEE